MADCRRCFASLAIDAYMRVDLFDFDLPPERIALRPVVPRDAARMLVVAPARSEPFRDRMIRDLPDFLRPGDILVVNDTRVIPARLEGLRGRGATRAQDRGAAAQARRRQHWRAFARRRRNCKRGDTIAFSAARLRRLSKPKSSKTAAKAKSCSPSPLPAPNSIAPIERSAQCRCRPISPASARADAQMRTIIRAVFAVHRGAVAAPTASLHFTPALVAAIAARASRSPQVTLHVGAGTFLPVKADDTQAHSMHAEWGEIDAETAARLNAARAAGGRIVAVGTTSLRLLESAATADGQIAPFSGETAIFITPGYRFKAVDLLLTNFHLPRSTLFMLVAAFTGLETMRAAYEHAIASRLPLLFLWRRLPARTRPS